MQPPNAGRLPVYMPKLPPITKAFILACVGFFCLFELLPQYRSPFELWYLQSGNFRPWQLLTYALLHGTFDHLFFNMLGLWMFGTELEMTWGPKRFAMVIIASVLTAAIVQLGVNWFLVPPARTVGASGAIFGLLLSYGMLFPDRIVEPVFPSIPMKTKYFVFIFGAIELVLGFRSNNGVAHFAHLGGMLGAWLLIRHWRRPPPPSPPPARRVH